MQNCQLAIGECLRIGREAPPAAPLPSRVASSEDAVPRAGTGGLMPRLSHAAKEHAGSRSFAAAGLC
jgi:hypothetical protein